MQQKRTLINAGNAKLRKFPELNSVMNVGFHSMGSQIAKAANMNSQLEFSGAAIVENK